MSLTYNIAAFDPQSADPSTIALNKYIISQSNNTGPKWHEMGASAYRALQEEGKTGWPAPPKLERAKDIFLPSREGGREIKCRLLEPLDVVEETGVFLHIHGGGHVLGHADWQDEFLVNLADATGLVVLSIEYRLAPEHPFPADTEDCYDVATYLVDKSLSPKSGPLKYDPITFPQHG